MAYLQQYPKYSLPKFKLTFIKPTLPTLPSFLIRRPKEIPITKTGLGSKIGETLQKIVTAQNTIRTSDINKPFRKLRGSLKGLGQGGAETYITPKIGGTPRPNYFSGQKLKIDANYELALIHDFQEIGLDTSDLEAVQDLLKIRFDDLPLSYIENNIRDIGYGRMEKVRMRLLNTYRAYIRPYRGSGTEEVWVKFFKDNEKRMWGGWGLDSSKIRECIGRFLSDLQKRINFLDSMGLLSVGRRKLNDILGKLRQYSAYLNTQVLPTIKELAVKTRDNSLINLTTNLKNAMSTLEGATETAYQSLQIATELFNSLKQIYSELAEIPLDQIEETDAPQMINNILAKIKEWKTLVEEKLPALEKAITEISELLEGIEVTGG